MALPEKNHASTNPSQSFWLLFQKLVDWVGIWGIMVPEFMDGLWNAILFRCQKNARGKNGRQKRHLVAAEDRGQLQNSADSSGLYHV